jgi:hypothetical protein
MLYGTGWKQEETSRLVIEAFCWNISYVQAENPMNPTDPTAEVTLQLVTRL